MSGFKRNTGRYEGSSEGTRPSSRTSGRATSNGGTRSEGGSATSEGSNKVPNFVKIGTLGFTKKVNQDFEEVVHDAKAIGGTLSGKIYLPKGAEELTLKNGDRVLVSFKVNEKSPDFVMANILIPRDGNSTTRE